MLVSNRIKTLDNVTWNSSTIQFVNVSNIVPRDFRIFCDVEYGLGRWVGKSYSNKMLHFLFLLIYCL